QLALRLCQSLLFYSKEFRVSNGFTSRERGKVADAHVYARRLCDDRQRLKLAFDSEASKPFACRRVPNRQRLNLSFNRTMQFDFDTADFREPQLARLDSKAS